MFVLKQIALTKGRTDREITTAGIIAALVNAAARFVGGAIFHWKGYSSTALLVVALEMFSALVFIPSCSSQLTFTISLCIIGTTYGLQLGLYPLVSYTLFRDKGAFSYSLLMGALSISNCLVLLFGNSVRDLVGGWDNLMYVLCGLAVVPLFNILWLHKVTALRRLKEIEDAG